MGFLHLFYRFSLFYLPNGTPLSMVMIDHIFSAEEEAGNIYFLLTPVALAFFVACDGSYDIRTVRLSTNSFTLAEVRQLQSI